MSKRNLFKELMSGIEDMQQAREGKITLRSHAAPTTITTPDIKPKEILKTREQLHVSRAVFARMLQVNVRTLENWEQGRARPNAQARILLRLVQRYPDTLQRLAT